MALDAISEEDWLILMLTVITFRLVNDDVTNLRHNAFATSVSSNKTVSAFHLFRCLFALIC